MVIETFFSEMGTKMMKLFSDNDSDLDSVREHLLIKNSWSSNDFSRAGKRLKAHSFKAEIRKLDLNDLNEYLSEKRDFVMRLLQNPVMLEHEKFTDLLMALSHLTEELANREDLTKLPDTDHDHLEGDIKRTYAHLVSQWISYMEYLKTEYPYLFSLAVRTNPFDINAKAQVE